MTMSIREGNAYDPAINENATVIWSLNATRSNVFYVSLLSNGWYTVSLVGPIRKHIDYTGKVIRYIVWPLPLMSLRKMDIDCSLLIRIIWEGNYMPFVITHSEFSGRRR